MEQQNSNTSPVLCRAGCGFYGSSAHDGMCSKCYKDTLNRKMQPPQSSASPLPTSPAIQIGGRSSPMGMRSTDNSNNSSFLNSPTGPVDIAGGPANYSASVPAFSHLNVKPGTSATYSTTELDLSTSPSCSSLPGSYDPTSPLSESAKKKNRCAECNKRVGLTAGFECRCGGMFCALHRYSDTHKCSFDYRQMGAEEIRRNNPAVRGEKVQKL